MDDQNGRPAVEVTGAMIEAGVAELGYWDSHVDEAAAIVASVFIAMERVRSIKSPVQDVG